MAKVYKAEFYITDMSNEFYSVDDLKEKLKNRQHSGGHLFMFQMLKNPKNLSGMMI